MNQIKKLYIFITNFYRPVLESLNTWYALIDQDTDDFFSMIFWQELSAFCPVNDNKGADLFLDQPCTFFEWYSNSTNKEYYIYSLFEEEEEEEEDKYIVPFYNELE